MNQEAKILLVEDEMIAQVVTREQLKEFGWKIDIASTGKEALDLIKNNNYLLVLMDIGLPDTNGFDLSRKMRESGFDNSIPIIALTAHDEKEYKDKVEQYGLNGFYTKPFSPEKAREIFKSFNLLSSSNH